MDTRCFSAKAEHMYARMGEIVAKTAINVQTALRALGIEVPYDEARHMWASFSEDCCAKWLAFDDTTFGRFCEYYGINMN